MKSLLFASILVFSSASAALAQLSEEQQYALSVGLTAGSLKTVCGFFEEGVLTEQQTRGYIMGYMESIQKKEKGAALAGSMKGYATSKSQHPSCPIP